MWVLEDISKQLEKLLREACDACKASTIALSGGLDSTIIAHLLKKKEPEGITIIAKDFVANDLTYCQMVSKQFGIKSTICNVDTAEILDAVEQTIKILKNFNDIEIRNNVVMYLAIKWAKDNGKNDIITGDGADELFAGYNFLVNKSGEDLDREIERVCTIMHFPTKIIGNSLGVEVETPFLSENIVEFAKKIPSNLKVRRENDTLYGKWVLRNTFKDKIPAQIAWRKKSPMQDGSGTAGLTRLFDAIIDDESFKEKKDKIEDSDHVTIRTKESMFYYEKFRKHYNMPVNKTQNTCPFCKVDVNNSKFCRMCGAYPI